MRGKRESLVCTAGVALVVALIGTLIFTGVALGEAATGACCQPSGACEDLLGSTCESTGGTFIGEGTSCSEISCDASFAAPLLSIVGLVAAVGLLGGVGLYRLVFRSRRTTA